MKLKQQIVRTLVAWAGLLAFMTLFRPDKLPVLLLIVPFVLLFAAFYSVWNLLSLFRTRFSAHSTGSERLGRLGLAVNISVILLIVLQSLGQLTLRDVATVAAILVLGYLYIARTLQKAATPL